MLGAILITSATPANLRRTGDRNHSDAHDARH